MDKKCDCGEQCSCGEQREQKQINMELNLGDDCNFRCHYCFEAGYYKPRSVEPRVVERFIELGKIVLEHGQRLSVSFWGGEPMLHMDAIDRVLSELGEYPSVDFLLYTNGWFVEQYGDVLLKHSATIGKRFCVQVSHDFLPPEINHRVIPGVDGAAVEQRVLDAIRWLDRSDVTYAIKTTGMLSDLEHHLFEQYMRFVTFREELRHKDEITMGYTPDTTDFRAIDEAALGEQLHKLLVYFAERRMLDTHFNWFYGNRKLMCAAGKSSCLVDVDGNALYCHGCLYYVKQPELADEVRFANIFDDNALFKIEYSKVTSEQLYLHNPQCAACEAEVCFRCNAINCRGDVSRWSVSNVLNSCNMYKFISKYIRAYLAMRERWLKEDEP